MQKLLLIGKDGVSEILPTLTRAGYNCRSILPEESLICDNFTDFCPEGLVLELKDDILLLQHVRLVLRIKLNICPIPILALATTALLNLSHLVIGVDDFILFPVNDKELVVRVQMLFRRFQHADSENRIHAGQLILDMNRCLVTLNGNEVPFAPRELQLLQFLMTHRGRAFTRENLASLVWGYQYEGDVRVVDAYIKRVRSRLSPPHNRLIETVRGMGYRFRPYDE